MHGLVELLKHLMNADWLSATVMQYGGLYLVAGIIFAETGLFAGFFLPGDSLLFVTGCSSVHHRRPSIRGRSACCTGSSSSLLQVSSAIL